MSWRLPPCIEAGCKSRPQGTLSLYKRMGRSYDRPILFAGGLQGTGSPRASPTPGRSPRVRPAPAASSWARRPSSQARYWRAASALPSWRPWVKNRKSMQSASPGVLRRRGHRQTRRRARPRGRQPAGARRARRPRRGRSAASAATPGSSATSTDRLGRIGNCGGDPRSDRPDGAVDVLLAVAHARAQIEEADAAVTQPRGQLDWCDRRMGSDRWLAATLRRPASVAAAATPPAST